LKNLSITYKLFLIVFGILVFAFSLVFIMVKNQITTVIDHNQRIAYTEKLNLITNVLDQKVERLKLTQMWNTYEESFQDSAIKTLRQTHYDSNKKNIYPLIIKKSGHIVMHPTETDQTHLSDIDTHLLHVIELRTGEYDFTRKNGQKNWVIVTYFSDWDWFICYVVPWDIKYKEAGVLQNSLLFIMAVVLFFTAFILRAIVVKMTGPIVTLTNASMEMVGGNLDHPVDVRRKDELGTLAKSFTHMRDAIREKMNALSQSEERIRKVLDSSPIAMVVITPDNQIVYLNQKFVEILGYNLNDIPSLDEWFSKAYPDQQKREVIEAEWNRSRTEYFETGVFQIMVTRVFCKDGSYKEIEFDFEAVGDQYITSLKDVTEYNQAKKDLLHEKEFSEHIINSMPGIFFLYKFENGQFRLKRWNSYHSIILGYSNDELKNKTPDGFFLERYHEQIKSSLEELSRKANLEIEINISKKNGDQVPFFLQALSFEDNNELYFVGSGMDISERISAEKDKETLQHQLAQSQKMEAVGTLAGGIAHDFNNILSVITGYSELMQLSLDPNSSDYESITEIMKAGLRARDLVKQILSFSRKSEKNLQVVTPHKIVEESLKLFRSSTPTTIDIKQNINPCGSIIADETQFHQIVMNLCTNASHSISGQTGSVGIRLDEIEISSDDISVASLNISRGTYILLEVSDTGSGISKENLVKIFDPYFTTKEKGKGTGLGLSIVHSIIKDYGGDISVYSEVGIGTTFRLYIPKRESDSGQQKSVQTEIAKTGDEHILLVDDEKSIVQLMEHILTSLGYTVDPFTESQKALSSFMAKPDKYDLVISDMTMPGMAGDILSKKLLVLRPDIPIILCTGFSDLMDEQKSKEAGIKAYITKPVLRSHLAETIRSVLDESSTL